MYQKSKKEVVSVAFCGNKSKMKTFLRLLAALLACIFCLTCIIACDDEEESNSDGEPEVYLLDGVPMAYDEWGYAREYDRLPASLDYDDTIINVLCWDTEKPEFQQSEEVDDSRLSAIYKRNEAIMARLGVELNFIQELSGIGTADTYAARVAQAKASDLHDFDILGCYSRTAGTMVGQGLLRNLTSIEGSYIDLERPWWPKNLVDNFAINNQLYYVSGDISITAIDQMHAIFFNKELVDEQFEDRAAGGITGSEYLYSFVYDGTWTIDVLIDLVEGAFKDRDGNTANFTAADRYGLCSGFRGIAAIYNGCNLKMIEQDVNETLIISSDYTSIKTTRLVSKLSVTMNSADFWGDVRSNHAGTAFNAPFTRGNALFYMNVMQVAETQLVSNDSVANYGILPYPKYESDQVNYYTMLGNPFTIFSIFSNYDKRGDEAETLKMLTAVLECWASEGFRKTTPVVFELGMQLKLSESQDETNMCEYLRAGIMFDMGRIFYDILGDNTQDVQFANAIQSNTAWATQYNKTLKQMRENLASFVKKLNNPEYQ